MERYLKKIFKDVKPMVTRDHTEQHRASTMLELFFDLAVVIAIASAASSLHHALSANHIASGLITFGMVFFALWWAWMNFTWFASRFDTDDAPYRIAVFIQICGALVFAAGIPKVFTDMDFSIGLLGFFIMRFSLISLFIRAALNSTEERTFCFINAFGMAICQAGWLIQVLYVPKTYQLSTFIFMALCELLVPYIAANWKSAKSHRHHLVERYGLLTIIVLGECLLACASIFQVLASNFSQDLAFASIGSLLITFCLWWLYFERSDYYSKQESRVTFTWGYGHIVIFASATIAGVGMVVVKDQLTGQAEIGLQGAAMTVAIPVAIYLIALWTIHYFPKQPGHKLRPQLLICAAIILATPFIPYSVFAIGAILVLLVATHPDTLHQPAGIMAG